MTSSKLESPSYVRKVKRQAGEPLTAREVEVMWLIVDGASNKIIASELGVSEHTAKFHTLNATLKCGGSNRAMAAVNFVLSMSTQAAERKLPRTQVKVLTRDL